MEKRFLAEYLRLSVEDGDVISSDSKAESDSIHHQRLLITRYREEKEIYLEAPVMEFVDDGYSGTNFQRPAIKELLSLVREGKICCIIVKDLSRFGRNYLEVGDYLEQIFPFMGVRFIAINDRYDSAEYIGTTGGIEIAFRSLLYDMYSKDLSAKMRSALKIRRKRGDFIGPRPPFGYEFSSDRKKLAVDLVAAAYVKRIFELACEGESTGKIAARLNEEKIPTPGAYKNQKGSQYHILDGNGYWNSKKVLKIIENKVYVGTVVNAKYKVTEIGAKQFKRVPDEKRIYVPNKHEAIVSEETFQKASEIIQNNGQQKGKKHDFSNKSILQGKLRCGNCKRSLIRITSTSIPYFTCEKAAYDTRSSCFGGRVKEPEIEKVILKKINEKLEKEEKKQTSEAFESNLKEIQKEIATLERQRDALKAEKQWLYEQFKMKQLYKKTYLERVAVLREKEDGINGQIEQAQKQRKIGENSVKYEEDISTLRVLNTDVVEAYIETIYVDAPERFHIIWKK